MSDNPANSRDWNGEQEQVEYLIVQGRHTSRLQLVPYRSLVFSEMRFFSDWSMQVFSSTPF